MSILLKTGFIDLKSVWPKWQVPPAYQEDSAHELRQDHFLPTYEFSLPVRVSQVCRAVWGQLQGTTENAVKTQIWIAISVYVLVAIVKKTLNLDQSLYTILQILSVTLFEKTPILRALASNLAPENPAWQTFDPGRPVFLASPVGRLQVIPATLPGLHPEAVVYRRGDWRRLGGGINRIIADTETDMGHGAAYYAHHVRLEN
jgi:hypothetical protein